MSRRGKSSAISGRLKDKPGERNKTGIPDDSASQPGKYQAAFDQDTTDDWRRSIAEVNDYIDTQVHIDIVPGMADEDGELKTELALDGLHLDPPGKELMARAINNAWDDITALPDSAWE